MLQTQVEELKKTAAPLPIPSMPDDEKLKSDLVKGTASLTDTMQAMQVGRKSGVSHSNRSTSSGIQNDFIVPGVRASAGG